LGQLQEAAQGSQAGVAGEVEDQVQGGEESAQEAVTGRAVQEGDECGFEVGVVWRVLAEPVAQSGARQAGLLGERTFVDGTVKIWDGTPLAEAPPRDGPPERR
jgi:hypothetical protein